MLLLDTNVLSELRKVRTGQAPKALVEWEATVSSTDLYLSVASIQEVEYSVLRLERKDPIQAAFLRRWVDMFVLPTFHNRILPVDTAIAQRCAKLHAMRTRPYMDALIAGTAYVHRMPVVTRNVADFEDTGVAVINPWDWRQ